MSGAPATVETKAMARERLAIVSADCHAGPAALADYAPFMDPRFRADFEDYCSAIKAFDEQLGMSFTGGGAKSMGEQGLWDTAIRTQRLDGDGVAAEVIYAQGSVPFGPYPAVGGGARLDFPASPAHLAAGCRAYNRWLAAFCANDPVRHLGVARVPLPDVEAAIEEMEFAASLGLRAGVHLPPLSSQTATPFFNDPMYEPFWAACEANRMVLNIHGGSGVTYGDGPEVISLVLAEVDWLSRRGLSQLIFSGVFERHPRLHLALTEQRTHWLAPLLKDFDSIYEYSGRFGSSRRLPRQPSEYFLSNCFIGASFLSRPECEARGAVGAQCFMWGSDYPHNEGTWPYTDKALHHTFGSGVPAAEIKAMLSGNAARCYYLDPDQLQAIAERIGPTLSEITTPIDVLPGEGPGETPVRSWAFRRHGAWH